MKNTFFVKRLFYTILLSVSIIACNSKNQQEKPAPDKDSIALTDPSDSELNSDQSALLAIVLGEGRTDGSILRNVSFGDPVSKVKAIETFDMFEEAPDHLGYTMETPQLETIDIQYFLDKHKMVDSMRVDVYLNSSNATKELWSASKAHFSKNYGIPKEQGKIISWNKNAVRVNMEDMSSGKDYGLKFDFSPLKTSVLARK